MRGRNPLLSTYRAGENRVTASMLAVFERIGLGLVESILSGATGETSLQMVAFSNQPTGRGGSVPDGRISAHFDYWIETKTDPNAVRDGQLRRHLRSLDDRAGQRLLVITPDAEQPQSIEELGDQRVLWFNFRALSGAIDQVTDNDDILVGERERLLLGELQALLAEDGLLDADDTVIVAAREAYGKYLDHGIYACQPGRSFRAGLTHMGFYAGGAIRPEIPRILHRRDAVALTRAEADALRPTEPYGKRLADAIDVLLAADPQNEGNLYQLFVLTKADEESTVRLEAPIINDTVAKSGRAWAWTLGQRYTSLEGLKDPTVKATSDI